ncbi:putative bifunctional diguanylate cyclase/phosphodiesterase [Granulosicoccus antarcticus]|uniref:Putative signaling protein n=1 Tax=Granulosicoccus antarcticus IMCC3135 TaxID=1192854 RepID=A0A2Z2NQI5_9GAMM|nr:EAL domain-containing protein [Granulosicoccus antarcticus]ASJ73736.1 putative signaling protein [Granulosicoccus antarcticus IMCC3135]
MSLGAERDHQNSSLEFILLENEILRHVLAYMPIGFCMLDQHDRLQLCNQQFVDVWNLPLEVCQQGTHFRTIMEHSHGEEVSFSGDSKLGDAGQKRREWLTSDGRRIDVLVHVLSEGTVLALHEDVTEKREAEHRIAQMAQFDALTGLYNRGMLYQKLEATLSNKDQGIAAMLYLDLNGFKQVNDTLGHPVGDKLLVMVAQRIRSCCKETDLVARLGGDEFAIIMTHLESAKGSELLSGRIIESLSKPFDIDGRNVYTSTCIGITGISDGNATADDIVKRSDMALYEAKSAGSGVFRHFVEDMEHNACIRRTLEIDLGNAIQNNEFELYYQPQIDLHTMKICGAEALIRWNHPTRGQVLPDEFIPVAEKIGLIVPIGNWVLKQACKEALNWPDSINVAVNVSCVQFGNVGMLGVDLLQEVKLALEQSGLPAHRLELEMTETAIMDDVDKSCAVLRDLKQLGVTTAIDDFGTGYSSLQYLRSFQFDHLKIDRSFVSHIETDVDALSIARTIVALGRTMGILSTAEGVETKAQLEIVKEIGCDKVQGYHYAKPCSVENFRSYINTFSKSRISGSHRVA